ncbi:5'-nucleotidase [Pseudofulvimonas gallinarii]|uniref:5'-nucleotidase n=2 Tax=Pseudofulvimonas gallinarii TaxID=634155 RepID=A0A4R3L677_9GAMM|nr:5'-nucleotidase [Pseudofulvimonas gallinarii]
MSAMSPHAVDRRLVVAISSRTLFDLDDSHTVFERAGVAAYADYQVAHENEPLAPGVAFPLVRKLLGLNQRAGKPLVEVILLSRNSSDTGLRVFNSIQHYGLDIVRAAFTGGAPPYTYIAPFEADLFLSANGDDVRRALAAGVAAAAILPSATGGDPDGPLRIAFDGDAVLFGDESERISQEQGIEAFHRHESEHVDQPLSGGPFRGFLAALHALQSQFPDDQPPIRTALVTARSAPAHKRVILTLREWGVRLDEAIFLGGRPKGPFLEAFAADIFFDDSGANIESARQFVASGHVPHGVSNPEQ